MFTKNFEIECGMMKFDVLVLKREKVVSSKGEEMLDGERIIEVEENRYKYLCVLQCNTIKESQKKDNFWRQCMRKNGINHERYTNRTGAHIGRVGVGKGDKILACSFFNIEKECPDFMKKIH